MTGGLLFALFLYWRVSQGGRWSRYLLLIYTGYAAALGGFAHVLMIFGDESVSTDLSWTSLVLFAVAAWCLVAPALEPLREGDQRHPPLRRPHGLRKAGLVPR